VITATLALRSLAKRYNQAWSITFIPIAIFQPEAIRSYF
jgi:hypothetical protein